MKNILVWWLIIGIFAMGTVMADSIEPLMSSGTPLLSGGVQATNTTTKDVTVNLYSAPLVNLSVPPANANTPTGVPSTASCSQFEGQCGQLNGANGYYKNCIPSTAGSCQCDFYTCGAGATCDGGNYKCSGAGYPDSSPCQYPGQKTFYCTSGICNYQARCGAMAECLQLIDKPYNSNYALTNCTASVTGDPMKCDCDLNEIVGVAIPGTEVPVAATTAPVTEEKAWYESQWAIIGGIVAFILLLLVLIVLLSDE